MMHKRNIVGASAAVLIGLGLVGQAADAAPGVVTQPINLRAGPSTDYPWLASLPPGTPADIHGCLDGWSWCDISVQGARGWAAGVGLQVVYDDQPEPLDGYGPQVGLPFVGFDFGNYWGRYYRDRPFYRDVDHWHGHGGPGPGGPGWDHGGPRGVEGGGYRGGGYGGGPGERGGPGRGGPGFDGNPGGQGGRQIGGGEMPHPEPRQGPQPLQRGPEPGQLHTQPGGGGPGSQFNRGGGPGGERQGGPDHGPDRHEQGGPGGRNNQQPN